MTKKYHFITGLPRSGSTLLSSILKQNPRFHASISDPLSSLVKGVLETSQAGPGMKYEVPIQRRKNLLKYIVDGYYADIDKPVVFNTSRGWTYLTPLIKEIMPDTKMIVCVRDINWIIDSFETAYRRNPLDTSTVYGGFGNSVYTRTEHLMVPEGIVGSAYIGVKQAITSNEKNMLMLVEYDQLCKSPDTMLRAIYKFIGEEYYQHDFNNVEGSWDEYDSEIGIKLHTVQKKVELKPRKTILPPDITSKYNGWEVWRQL